MTKPQIILASASIGRKDLLEKLGLPFAIIPSTIDEDKIIHKDPYEMLQLRARAKAEDVIQRLASSNQSFDRAQDKRLVFSSSQLDANQLNAKRYLVLAADSMAILNCQTFGKARDKSHARQILLSLMGKTHIFTTATCFFYLKYLKSLKLPKRPKVLTRWQAVTKTSVTLRTLSSISLTNYLTMYDFTRFAAGYALNETPWDLVSKIDGSYTNVIGLPFEVLLPILTQLNLI